MKKVIAICIALALVGLIIMTAIDKASAAPPTVLSWKQKNLTTSTGIVNGGTSTAVDLDAPYSKHTITATWQGSAPTFMQFDIEGSVDCATSFYRLARATMMASPFTFHATGKPVQCLRVVLNTQSGGSLGVTKLFVNSTSGGN